MKTAIYIEQGITQLVLTPENPWETSIIAEMERSSHSQTVTMRRGSFFPCNGGWIRQSEEDDSLILSCRKVLEPQPPTQH